MEWFKEENVRLWKDYEGDGGGGLEGIRKECYIWDGGEVGIVMGEGGDGGWV